MAGMFFKDNVPRFVSNPISLGISVTAGSAEMSMDVVVSESKTVPKAGTVTAGQSSGNVTARSNRGPGMVRFGSHIVCGFGRCKGRRKKCTNSL